MHPRVRRSVGIDLGTTNSVIALLDDTGSTLLAGQQAGRITFPSLVGWDERADKLVAGPDALALVSAGATLPLASVKRHMGLDRRFGVGTQQLSPEEVSAAILRGLRDGMLRTLASDGRPWLIDSAIVTMPAYFNHNQIEATRQAGEMAGYEVVELLHEPTAAAIFYSWIENHDDATYLVYDLGGGTFDVSVIRRRLGDHEVLSVSGDPFLGGDDFDRLLASHLVETGTWKWGEEPASVEALFDPKAPEGAVPFARLVRIAEQIKIELSTREGLEHYVPRVLTGEDGRELSLEVSINRSTFHRLIRDKVSRTIDCCHEALGRARLRPGEIDHVILVGGSSRVPLVREVVEAAFANPALPERVRSAKLLLHEPDLCVAYGAALRAAGHGTRYLFGAGSGDWPGTRAPSNAELELHVTSPGCTREVGYRATGVLRLVSPLTPPRPPLPQGERGGPANGGGRAQPAGEGPQTRATPPPPAGSPSPLVGEGAGGVGGVRSLLGGATAGGERLPAGEGASVRIRSLATGLLEEAFADARGSFECPLELQPESDNALEWAVCDLDGQERARVRTVIRHQAAGRPLGQGVLPTQLITRPLSIEVLTRARQRVKQIIAPVGATLPGTFKATCRTSDQSGRIVVPIFEDNRVVKQLVIDDLGRALPAGSPVDVEFVIDVKHTIEVRVHVRQPDGRPGRTESATIEPPPPPRRPTRAEIDDASRELEEALEPLTGRFRVRLRAKAQQVRKDLLEALSYDDEPRAIQRFAELRDLIAQAERAKSEELDPAWPVFKDLVKRCLELAGEVARTARRDKDELVGHIRAQERYAEQAHEEHNQGLYKECWDNLQRYGGYLEQLLTDALPRPAVRPTRPPEEEAKEEVEALRGLLAKVWRQASQEDRGDLEDRLVQISGQAKDLDARAKSDPLAALREARRLAVEVQKVQAVLDGEAPDSPPEHGGLLEGSA